MQKHAVNTINKKAFFTAYYFCTVTEEIYYKVQLTKRHTISIINKKACN